MPQITPIVLFNSGEFLLSAGLISTPSGYVSEWWASKLYNAEVSVAAHLTIPVYGTTVEVAERRVGMISGEVDAFVASVSGGLVSGAGLSPYAVIHAMRHAEHYYPGIGDESLLERTAILYNLLSEFRVPKPAKVIATLEKVASVRTVHDRIARAREGGLIRAYGQGKTYF